MHLGAKHHWVPLSIKIHIHFLHIVCQTLFFITLKEYLFENQAINDSNNVPLPINNGMQDSDKPRGDEPIKYVCICMYAGLFSKDK